MSQRKYFEGQQVEFNFAGLGVKHPTLARGRGRIRGNATGGPVSQWIVEVLEKDGGVWGDYPFTCIIVPEPLIQSLL